MEYFHISASFIVYIQFYMIIAIYGYIQYIFCSPVPFIMIGFFAMAIVFTSDAAFLLIMVLIYIYLATFRNHIAPIIHIRKKNPKKISQLLNKLLTFPHLNDNLYSEAVLYHLAVFSLEWVTRFFFYAHYIIQIHFSISCVVYNQTRRINIIFSGLFLIVI